MRNFIFWFNALTSLNSILLTLIRFSSHHSPSIFHSNHYIHHHIITGAHYHHITSLKYYQLLTYLFTYPFIYSIHPSMHSFLPIDISFLHNTLCPTTHTFIHSLIQSSISLFRFHYYIIYSYLFIFIFYSHFSSSSFHTLVNVIHIAF